MKKVGEGSSGVVYVVQEKPQEDDEARETKQQQRCCFAIKAYKTASRRGVCTAAIREIGLLRELRHPNVIQMRQVHIAQKERAVFLSYEYINHDLQHVIRHHLSQHKSIPEYTIKSLLWQILRGCDYLHSNWVMHRDLKPSNILLMSEGEQQGVAKIADFGLARIFKNPKLQPLTADGVVVTLWYRAPELLLGAQHYSPAIDVWAIGCLFGELLRLRPLFYSHQLAGNKFQVKQMERIINILGQPCVSRWPGLAETCHWKNNTDGIQGYKPSKGKARKLENMLSLKKDAPAIKLLKRMLEYDPQKRISAAEALKHEYFHTKPYPGSNCFVDMVGRETSNLEVDL
jgi:cyclin-dependent kinase 8/11